MVVSCSRFISRVFMTDAKYQTNVMYAKAIFVHTYISFISQNFIFIFLLYLLDDPISYIPISYILSLIYVLENNIK